MIEQSVSLASNGVVKVPGYEQLVRFGYTKNRGVYRLAVTASGEWAGLAIRCFWHVPGVKDPASSLVVDGYVDVPASVTAQPGNGCITFEGSNGTKTVTSADLRYRVSANSGTEDGTEPEPGTPAWQELVDAVHTDATAAEQAKTDAQTAAQQAEASAEKAGKALSDTITAKEDALKAIGDKQTTATQAVDTARDKALQQVETSTEAAQTAANEAATSADKAAGSEKAAGDAQAKAAESLQELKEGIASGNFKGEPGTSPTVTVQDIAGGHRIVITDATGTSSVDVMDGKQGDPGKDATVDATLSQSGKAADAKVTGDALATKAVIDDTAVGADAWSSKHIIDTLCPPLEESGNPVQCYPVAGYPLGVVASWEPTQEGSGEPSPENVRPIKGRDTVKVERCGEQLLSYSQPIETDSDIRVAIMSSDQILLLANAARGQTFETSFDLETANVVWADYDEDWRRRIGFEAALTKASDGLVTYQFPCWINSTSSEFKATGKITVKTVISLLDDRYTKSAESKLFFYVQNMKSGHVKATNFSIKLVQNTAYTPYQGDTLALRLPTTIYGGTVDAVTGEGEQKFGLATFDGSEAWTIGGLATDKRGWYYVSPKIVDAISGVPKSGNEICSHYPHYDVANNNTGNGCALVWGAFRVRWGDIIPENTDAWKSYLAAQYAAGTPVQIAYKLATPTPFTATGAQPIPALSGVNTLLTDVDSVAVTGRADPIKRITDLEDAVASMT